jgi:hypothetical protein
VTVGSGVGGSVGVCDGDGLGGLVVGTSVGVSVGVGVGTTVGVMVVGSTVGVAVVGDCVVHDSEDHARLSTPSTLQPFDQIVSSSAAVHRRSPSPSQ